jgi:hypothetical protein
LSAAIAVSALNSCQKADPGVEQQHDEDDREVRPMPHGSRQDRGDLDHPRDRPQKYEKRRASVLTRDSGRAFSPNSARRRAASLR